MFGDSVKSSKKNTVRKARSVGARSDDRKLSTAQGADRSSDRVNGPATGPNSPNSGGRGLSSIRRGASAQKITFKENLASYFKHHGRVFVESFQRLWLTPVSTLLTIAVIAIALALPTGLYVLLKNVQLLSEDWGGNSQISLFLKPEVIDAEGAKLTSQLTQDPRIARAQFLSRDMALQEFIDQSGFGGVLAEIGENPLPGVVIVYPADISVAATEGLKVDLQSKSEVDFAQMDAEWVRRLHSMIDLGERLVFALAFGLVTAVLLVMINTIRLTIDGRKDEIVIVKLVGGTDAFVRRPFLYTGLWYGLGGGLLAVILVQSVLLWLEAPISNLTSLYESQFASLGLGVSGVIGVIVISTLVGLLGARLAVARHLREIEPE